jgi:hypothetical protein
MSELADWLQLEIHRVIVRAPAKAKIIAAPFGAADVFTG